LAVGRFAETKSPHLTLLAFHQVWLAFPQAKLIMVGKDGGGELFEACQILVKALNMETAVEFKGILSPEEVYAEMQKAYAFVQHSVTTPLNGDSEGTPVAVMEAMACGLPVVATRHAGIADMIENEVNGLLVEEYEVNAMADSMKYLVQNPQKARELGQAAASHIHAHPLVNNHIRLLWDILKNEMP
jgi:glycosyltransferase involved in cell wall biosynthesis